MASIEARGLELLRDIRGGFDPKNIRQQIIIPGKKKPPSRHPTPPTNGVTPQTEGDTSRRVMLRPAAVSSIPDDDLHLGVAFHKAGDISARLAYDFNAREPL